MRAPRQRLIAGLLYMLTLARRGARHLSLLLDVRFLP